MGPDVASERRWKAAVLRLELKRNTVASFERYPFAVPCIRDLESLSIDRAMTVLIGENGSGKSTLLEAVAIAAGFNPEGGSKSLRFETRSSHSELHEHIRLVKGRPWRGGYFLRAESWYNLGTRIEELDREPAAAPRVIESYGGTSLHERSHGESFMALLRSRFKGDGFYVLDEPEAALSIKNQIESLGVIQELVNRGAQFLIATHSPILMAYPGALIYELRAGAAPFIRNVSYLENEHVLLMRTFLEDPPRYIREQIGL